MCKLSGEDEAGWVVHTISKTVPLGIQWFRQKQLRLERLTITGWGDAVDYFWKCNKKDIRTELRVQAVIELHMDDIAAANAPTLF